MKIHLQRAYLYSTGCDVSPCRHHFTNFKRLRESYSLRRRTSNQGMQFTTMSLVRDPRGTPYLRWIMPAGIGEPRGVGWAKQRRFARATRTQHAVLSQVEIMRLTATESEFEHMSTQEVARTQLDTLQERRRDQLERAYLELDRRRRMQGPETPTETRVSHPS